MEVMWQYLDKRSATVAALKDYPTMQFILEQSVKPADTQEKGESPETNGDANGADRDADVMRARYETAVEYMEWFGKAWDMLKEDERHVLSSLYWGTDFFEQGRVLDSLCEEYNIERTSVYKKKNRALDRLTVLLYGK